MLCHYIAFPQRYKCAIAAHRAKKILYTALSLRFMVNV